MKLFTRFLIVALLFASLALAQSGFGSFPPGAGGAGNGGSPYSGASATYAAGTYYFPPGGGLAANTTETSVLGPPMPVAGSVSNLSLFFTGTVGVGVTMTFTFRDGPNGSVADQALTCQITNSSSPVACQDSTVGHTFSYAAQDRQSIKLVVAGGSVTGSVLMVWATPGIPGPSGATGATGATGSTGYSAVWHTQSGAPSSGTGSNGDMDLDTASGNVYGPKAAGSWGSVVANIQGPTGAAGAAGATGAAGANGTNGSNGTNGTNGAPGLASGVLASIPSTCTAGAQLYQATDQPVGLQLYACTATNTWTRVPYAQGTSNPGTCSLGQIFFNTAAAAGSNIELCTATNTWTQVTGGSGGEVQMAGSQVNTTPRTNVNFTAGFSGSDDSGNNRVNVTPSSTYFTTQTGLIDGDAFVGISATGSIHYVACPANGASAATLKDHMLAVLEVDTASTSTADLNWCTFGVASIKRYDGTTDPATDMVVKAPILLMYDATNGVWREQQGSTGGGGTVTTTGSPSSGPLTKFSGGASITNTDLTGDCTTSGGEATSCSGLYATYHSVSTSATPTFTCTSKTEDIFSMTLSANVTAITLSGCATGETLIVDFVQSSASPSYTVTFGSTFITAYQVGTTSSKHNTLAFFYNGTNAIGVDAGAINQ